jgi:hypothetical protein
MWCSRRRRWPIKRKSPKNPRATFLKLIRRSTTSMVASSHMSQGERRNSQHKRPWRSRLPPPPLEYLKWFEVPITFDCSDHPDFVLKAGRYPLIVSPIIKEVKLNRVLVDGGSSQNILFLKTFDQMGLSMSLWRPSRVPFHGIVLGIATTPVGWITLPITFGT